MAQAQVAESRPRPPQNPIGQLSGGTLGQIQSSVSPVNSYTANSAPFASKNTGGWQPYRSANDSFKSTSYQTTSYQTTPSQPFGSVASLSDSYGSNNDESQFESRVQQLALNYRNADLKEKENISKILTQLLIELFDARHKAQSSRVEALKAEIQQTQELLDKRLQNKSKIIERRVKELTGQQDELSWNASVPVANPGSTLAEIRPIQTPIQNSGFTPANNTVPYSPVNNYSPKYTNPQLFTAPSDILPSAQPVEIPRTSPELDNSPSRTFRTSDLNVNESLPTPSANTNPTPTSLPFNENPSSNNPVNAPLELGPPSNSPVINNPVNGPLESQRSFMNIGFKLKGLMRQLEGEQSIKGATKVKSEIEETKSVWEFEKSSLKSELESVEDEYELVTKQLFEANEQVNIQRARVNAGTSADGKLECSKAEVAKSEVERQLLQLRSRMTTLKKSIDWMENFFKEKPTSPPSTVAELEALPPAN